MSHAECRATWAAASDNDRAAALDSLFPGCACEPYSLRKNGGPCIADGEVLARVLTSPDGYDMTTGTLIASKLQHTTSHGLSVIRQGADDGEILATVDRLMTGPAEPKALIGAVVVPVSVVRSFADPQRWYGVYATDEEELEYHADLLATVPPGGTNQRKRTERERRYALKAGLERYVIRADQPRALLNALRQAGV